MNLDMQAADVFRENVKSQLAERQMSISALARIAGIQQASMSKILSGDESVTLQRADRIATALGKSLADLLKMSTVPALN